MAEGFKKEWLAGQVYRGSKIKEVVKDGRKVRVPERYERPLTEKDVLSFRVEGDQVIMVTADGQKLTVKDVPAKVEKVEKAEKTEKTDKA